MHEGTGSQLPPLPNPGRYTAWPEHLLPPESRKRLVILHDTAMRPFMHLQMSPEAISQKGFS